MRAVRKLPAIPQPIEAVGGVTDANDTVAFGVHTADAEAHSPEQWARATFEGPAAPLRWFLLVGWRLVLGLRLGPLNAPDHVLGWKIAGRGPNWVKLELRSWLLSSDLVFWVDASDVVMATFVRYDRGVAALVWPPVGIVHRRVVPYLLTRAPGRAVLAAK